MKECNLYEIDYVDSKNQTSNRKILTSSVPSVNITAIDVSELTEEEQNEMQGFLKEYKEYVKLHNKNMFNFEDWVSHSKGKEIKPKWKNFTQSRITEK